jgi:hypothetical protein
MVATPSLNLSRGSVSFEMIGLGKLLNAMYASNAQRISMMRSDIRNEIAKENESGFGKGGDFYGPFWADAKDHVSGNLDLRLATEERVASNKGRKRLYEMLRNGFLLWWEEKRRLRNVPFRIIERSVKARYEAPGLGSVKVENILAITVGDDGHRILYPYFFEDPVLSDEAARLGLWVMSQCITGYGTSDMRLLDVIRGQSFSDTDTPLIGNEDAIFLKRYAELLAEWRTLKAEYD